MCRMLKVHRSGFYAWLKSPESARAKQDRKLLEKIRQAYEESYGLYGSPRIHRCLKDQGIRCGKKRVERLMRQNGIKASRGYKKRSFKTGKPAVVAPNLLEQQFNIEAINKVWVTDITYIRGTSGWLFLAVVMDLCSRKVVGWSVRNRMNTELVVNALECAIQRRRPEEGLVIHSDQGSQFGSYEWLTCLKKHGIKQSMSRRGNCYDNAAMESFFSTLKMEQIGRTIFSSVREAYETIFNFIEMFYNPTRMHGHLKGLSPNKFEEILVS